MNSDWLPVNTSHILDSAHEAFAKRKPFLNLDPTNFFILSWCIICIKILLSGYAVVHLVRKKVTYAFLFFQICVLFFLRDTTQYASSYPNTRSWYYFCAFYPDEFFLDCYIAVIVFHYFFDEFSTKPRKLITLIVVLYTVNLGTDQFVSGPTTSTFDNIVKFYVPIIWMHTLLPLEEKKHVVAMITVYGTMWVVSKISWTELVKTPAVDFLRSKGIRFEGWNLEDFMSLINNRKPFLYISYNEYLFYAVLLLKSLIVPYAVRYVIGLPNTIAMIFFNYTLSAYNTDEDKMWSSIARFMFIMKYQRVFDLQQYPAALSIAIWFWVGCDNHYQFFIDVFLTISALVHIANVYIGAGDRLSTLILLLYFVDCFGNQFIGEPLGALATVATLYFPVVLISACTGLNKKLKYLCMLVLVSLWFVFKYVIYFEYSAKYLYSFQKTAEAFFWNLRAVLSRRLRFVRLKTKFCNFFPL